MKRSYHTIDKQGKVGQRKLTEFLVHDGQALLPMLELIEQSRMAVDELIDVMGRASIEAVLVTVSSELATRSYRRGEAATRCLLCHSGLPPEERHAEQNLFRFFMERDRTFRMRFCHPLSEGFITLDVVRDDDCRGVEKRLNCFEFTLHIFVGMKAVMDKQTDLAQILKNPWKKSLARAAVQCPLAP